MRTNIKSIAHFNDYIERQPKRIERFNENIANGKVAENNLKSVYRKQFMISLNTLIAMYSRGDEINEIKKDILNVINYMQRGWKDDQQIPADKYQFDDYVLMLFMLSLGVLLDIEDSEFDKIVEVLDNSGRKDKLLEYIIEYRIKGRTQTDELMYEQPFKNLIGIIKDSDKQNVLNLLSDFLEKKWYSGMRNVYWYDNHKSRHDTFFGYWSFEVAAIVKIMDINPDEINKHLYFPSDLL